DSTGKVVHGLTAPDGKFLANGATQLVDGVLMYGSMTEGGGFLSEDGKTFVTPSGVVEHGKTTDDGHFLTPRVIDGTTYWGGDTTDNGWISQDGTIYIDSSGTVEHGISTPDGNFLKDGTTHTLPNGTVIYGYNDGPDFYSADGKTIVLADGTVVTGTLDTTTGVFTSTGGQVYVLTDSGIESGTLQSDGSIALADGQTFMTPASWTNDLKELADAITFVQGKADTIADQISTITTQYSTLEEIWATPAGQTFTDVATRVNSAMQQLQTLLGDTTDRMQMTHDNYQQAEEKNTANNAAGK
ncbi:WXG100 family type VII secretion target, partial [Streptomyces sp. DvalAA-14]|uniref:WXG100 family type VII secretion target n=1 Tax=unclassified Streptomyces TaxID=2593676 RepID=UPI00081BBC14